MISFRSSFARPFAAAVCLALAACSSSATINDSTPSGPAGGPVKGPADTHCNGVTPQSTSMAVCHITGGDGGGGTGGQVSDYGPTHDGTSADDDDCKYSVVWTSTPIYENYDVTFTVTAKDLTDGKPATGSMSLVEAYLNDVHPAPDTDQVSTEGPLGTYTIGPVQFDAPGQWTVRFHLFEQCSDIADNSPHGHAAFFLNVP